MTKCSDAVATIRTKVFQVTNRYTYVAYTEDNRNNEAQVDHFIVNEQVMKISITPNT